MAESFRFCEPPDASPLAEEAEAACESNEKAIFPDDAAEDAEDEDAEEEEEDEEDADIDIERATF
jgi:hypothetical protein